MPDKQAAWSRRGDHTRGPRLLLAAKQPRKIAELYEAIRPRQVSGAAQGKRAGHKLAGLREWGRCKRAEGGPWPPEPRASQQPGIPAASASLRCRLSNVQNPFAFNSSAIAT